jgi:hypothetical protein
MASLLSALLKLSVSPAIGAYESLRLVQNSVDGPNISRKAGNVISSLIHTLAFCNKIENRVYAPKADIKRPTVTHGPKIWI